MSEPEQVDAATEKTVAANSEGTDAADTTDAAAPAFEADEILLASVDLARGALLEVTPAETVGSVVGHVVDDEHVLTLHFAADVAGYPGWHWSVTLTRVDDGEATVLETELMPGEAALLAPEWVPWSERMADYRAAQDAAAAAAAGNAEDGSEPGASGDAADGEDDVDDDADEDDEDEDELDDEDLDDEAELAGAFGRDDGDDEFDGIDIDALDDSDDDEWSDDDDDAAATEVPDDEDQSGEPAS